MKIPDFVINLHKGMDNLNFGAAVEEVRTFLGEPSEVETLEKLDEDDLNTLLFYYNDLGLTVFFEGDEYPVLTCFETDNEAVSLFGRKVFDLNENQAIALLKEHGYSELYIELEEWGEKRISFDDALIDFYFVNDKLVTVNWGILVNGDSDDEV